MESEMGQAAASAQPAATSRGECGQHEKPGAPLLGENLASPSKMLHGCERRCMRRESAVDPFPALP